MNKLQQDTLEVIQEYLPRIAVALEEIAKELKEQKSQKQYSADTLKQAMQMLKGE